MSLVRGTPVRRRNSSTTVNEARRRALTLENAQREGPERVDRISLKRPRASCARQQPPQLHGRTEIATHLELSAQIRGHHPELAIEQASEGLLRSRDGANGSCIDARVDRNLTCLDTNCPGLSALDRENVDGPHSRQILPGRSRRKLGEEAL